MQTPSLQITQTDYHRLQSLLNERTRLSAREQENVAALCQELARAEIKPAEDISPDVVTLHSRVQLLDLQTNEILEFTVVLPEEADLESGCISILAPLGTAMLGFRKGDVFEWKMPGGMGSYRIEAVLFQPESIGRSTFQGAS
ncbi:MAG TPA: GreA/GreB family elongation factor [Terrimicrobiaceae bacterium]|nr:GreA/GreB family elongation factor [Terrimicrobiaceae bacterium]